VTWKARAANELKLPFKVVRSNGHDEVLARAMNVLMARVNPLGVCPHENSGCGPISLQSRRGSECKKDCSREAEWLPRSAQ
jgi:hypothetical protein